MNAILPIRRLSPPGTPWRVLGLLGLSLAGASAQAGPVPLGLSIQGQVSVDVVNSADTLGAGSQAVTNTIISGGSTNSLGFTGTPAAALVMGALTQTGDGIGSRMSMSGVFGPAGAANSGSVFVDYVLSLSNTSVFSYTAVFNASWLNTVTAAGNDAFAYNQWSLLDSGNNELMATDHQIDKLFQANNLIYDSLNQTLSVTLAAGQSASFSALQQMIGGANDSGSTYDGLLDVFLELRDVTGGPTQPVPLPGSLALASLGLLLLARHGRRAARR